MTPQHHLIIDVYQIPNTAITSIQKIKQFPLKRPQEEKKRNEKDQTFWTTVVDPITIFRVLARRIYSKK